MEALLDMLLRLPEAVSLAEAVERGDCPAAATGLSGVHKAQLAAALHRATGRPLLLVCDYEGEADRMANDLRVLLGKPALSLAARETRLPGSATVSRQWEQRRLGTLYRLTAGQGDVVAATCESLLQKTCVPASLRSRSVSLALGARMDLTDLTARLVESGYTRCDQVEGPGQFAVRGGILDVFSPGMEDPVRCEFFGDEIDSLGTFDPLTQRRTAAADGALILPAVELAPGAPAASPLAYFPPDTLVCLCESGRLEERLKGILFKAREDTEANLVQNEGRSGQGEKPDRGSAAVRTGGPDVTAEYFSRGQLLEALCPFPLLMLEALPTSRYPFPPKTLLSFQVRQLSAYGGSLQTAAADLEHYVGAGYAVVLLCSGEARCRNMCAALQERGLPAALNFPLSTLPGAGEIFVADGALSAGTEFPQLKLAVLTEGQLTSAPMGRSASGRRERGTSNRRKLLSYTDLSYGDLVVHTQFGVGRFEGLQKMPVDGVEQDYIKIAYAGDDLLYVPATSLDMVSKYIGGGGDAEDSRPVKLNHLGGGEWKKQKSRAKAAAKDLAKGLIALYAQRQRQPGYAFSPDSPWQQEFESAFDYVETDDQLQCIAEIKRDMERPVPMDRLLCGDVGYGKTEVALRAVMKCVLDGKQAAILVPTTVLAQQHYATAANRFRGFPVEIRVLSRFQTPSQARKTLDELRNGRVDVLIGTHKLLQKNVVFKDLGLLVIDEEQRFGVTHKERLKEISRQVDVLTLSATPIPRTLNMALSGIRDMSTLEEPPAGRQPVQTYVVEHDWALLSDAIRQELSRGGQVYYLHNRVETIDLTASRLQKLLGPEVRIVIGHGRMSREELSDVMQRMVDGEAQVLVCTTIIETGIDIPNVNTLIIEDADRMGLSQLHQLRGRIGRSSRRAYAYMTFRKGKTLSEISTKRLTAIREYVEFGSGFKIAMRDLEIRGAGNLLGPEQSGYMMSVGYDMYLKLLEDAVLEEQGKKGSENGSCTAELTVNAHIPQKYVPSDQQRMDLYRRIAAIRDREDASDLVDELVDRYGDPPKPVCTLLDVALLRLDAVKAGLSDITQRGSSITFTIADFQAPAIGKLCTGGKYRQRLHLSAGEIPYLTLDLTPGQDPLGAARELVEALAMLRTPSEGEK